MKTSRFVHISDIFLYIVVLILLGIGSIVVNTTINNVSDYKGSYFSLSYPEIWTIRTNSSGNYIKIENINSKSRYKSNLSVKRIVIDKIMKDKKIKPNLNPVMNYMIGLQKQLPMFRQFNTKNTKILSMSGVEFHFAYVYDPPANPSHLADIPIVIKGFARILLNKKGTEFYSMMYRCDQKLFRENLNKAKDIFETLRVKESK